jgi:DNA adenine methylase
MTFLKWVGGKRLVADEIVNRCKEEKYAEAFLGGGSVMIELLLNGYQGRVVVNDLNKELIRMWIDVRDNVEELCQEILDMGEKITEERYYALREEYNEIEDGVRKSALFITLNRTGFRGLYRVNGDGKFNVPFGNYKKACISGRQLRCISRLIQGVVFVTMDYKDFLEKHVDAETFVYLDPPYGSFDGYTQDGFNGNEFKEVVKGCKGHVVVSEMSDWECEGFGRMLIIDVQDKINSKRPGRIRKEAIFERSIG